MDIDLVGLDNNPVLLIEIKIMDYFPPSYVLFTEQYYENGFASCGNPI